MLNDTRCKKNENKTLHVLSDDHYPLKITKTKLDDFLLFLLGRKQQTARFCLKLKATRY